MVPPLDNKYYILSEQGVTNLVYHYTPTLQVAEKLDKQNNTSIIKDMVKNAKLTDRLEKVLKQLSVTVEEMTVYDKED